MSEIPKNKILSKIYYKSKDEYDDLLNKRKNSESVRMLDVKIHDNIAFYCLCPEIYDLSIKIMEFDKKIQFCLK